MRVDSSAMEVEEANPDAPSNHTNVSSKTQSKDGPVTENGKDKLCNGNGSGEEEMEVDVKQDKKCNGDSQDSDKSLSGGKEMNGKCDKENEGIENGNGSEKSGDSDNDDEDNKQDEEKEESEKEQEDGENLPAEKSANCENKDEKDSVSDKQCQRKDQEGVESHDSDKNEPGSDKKEDDSKEDESKNSDEIEKAESVDNKVGDEKMSETEKEKAPSEKDANKDEKNKETEGTKSEDGKEKSPSEKEGEKSATEEKDKTPSETDKDGIEKEGKKVEEKKEEDSGKSQKHMMFESCGNDTEDMRPVAKLLYSLGADLCKQQIYKDLLRVQDKKKSQNKLNEKEEKQLEKLRTAYEELGDKNQPYSMTATGCKQCHFKTESGNVLEWHMEFAHGQENGNYMCSFCKFETRQPGNFFFHMEAEHNRKGRIYMKQAFYSCALCPFENNSKPALTKHRVKCEKHFQLKRNLEPAPTDCDIPLKKLKQLAKKPLAPKPQPFQSQQTVRKMTQIRPANSMYSTQNMRLSQPQVQFGQQMRGSSISFVQRPGVQPQIIQAGNNMYTLVNNQGQFMIQPTSSSGQAINLGSARPSFPLVQPAIVGQQQNYMRMSMPSVVTAQQQRLLQQKRLEEQKEAELKRIAANAQAQAQKALQEVLKQQQQHQKKANSSRSGGQAGQHAQFEICEICGGFVKDRESLRIHFYWAHKVDISKELFDRKQPHLACEHCPNKFWTYQGYSRHRQMKHPNMPAANQHNYTCPICRTANISNLLHHFFQVHRITLDMIHKQKKCPMCGGSFKNENMTRLHILNQHRNQLQVIKAPSKSSPSSKKGSPVPTGLFENAANKKKFEPVCSLCNITFPNLDAFSYHCNKMHIFKCGRCPQKWSSQELLNEHYTKVHKHEAEPCELCDQNVTIGRPMIRHMKRTHLKECSVVVPRMPAAVFMKHLQKTKQRIRLLDAKKKAEAEEKGSPVKKEEDAVDAKKNTEEVSDTKVEEKNEKSTASPNVSTGNEKTDSPGKDSEDVNSEKDKNVEEVMEVDGETIVIHKEEEMEVDGEKIVIQKQDD